MIEINADNAIPAITLIYCGGSRFRQAIRRDLTAPDAMRKPPGGSWSGTETMTASVSADELDFVQIDRKLVDRAVKALERAKSAGLRVVTAESCTGGLIATVLSEAPGAAEYLDGGFVTYTPEQKCTALKLDPKLIEQYGAVSAQVADAMARGALDCSQADIAVSVTGVAGPEPDERGNPVGLVYLACARKAGNCVGVKREFGDIGRSRIRYEAAMEAITLITSQTGALR